MKKTILAGLLLAVAAGVANAAETGIINQAGPYEATMQFYLHPAHGFPGRTDAAQPSVSASASETLNAKAKEPTKRVASARESFGAKTRYSLESQVNSK